MARNIRATALSPASSAHRDAYTAMIQNLATHKITVFSLDVQIFHISLIISNTSSLGSSLGGRSPACAILCWWVLLSATGKAPTAFPHTPAPDPARYTPSAVSAAQCTQQHCKARGSDSSRALKSPVGLSFGSSSRGSPINSPQKSSSDGN